MGPRPEQSQRPSARTKGNTKIQRQGGEIMSTNKKETSKRVASIASDILRDKRYSDKSKSAAGSALAQTPSSKKK